MTTLPIPLLVSLFLGLISLAILAAGFALLADAVRQSRRRRPVARERGGHHERELPRGVKDVRSAGVTPRLLHDPVGQKMLAGLALLGFAFLGRHIVQLGFQRGEHEPQLTRSGTVRTLAQPDGTTIDAEVYGPPNGPILVLHGWGVRSTAWYYAKSHLSDRFRVIVWDLPGLGLSGQPGDRDYGLDKMASDLRAVLQLAEGRRVVLVGHSIGGMINLTFCRLYPQLLWLKRRWHRAGGYNLHKPGANDEER